MKPKLLEKVQAQTFNWHEGRKSGQKTSPAWIVKSASNVGGNMTYVAVNTASVIVSVVLLNNFFQKILYLFFRKFCKFIKFHKNFF